MNLVKKITQIFSLLFLITLLASCKPQCFSTDEFDVSSVSVDAYPTIDGIDGSGYDPNDGGQTAHWHDTGLKSNGDMFLIRITGAWTPWNGGTYHDMSNSELLALGNCKTCAKKDPSDKNCICYSDQSVTSEPFQTCNPSTQQDQGNLCSCTKNNGSASDYGVYHFPLNYYDKNEVTLIPDKQNACKFVHGMGAYIGLFGRDGVTDPSRIYHLFIDEYDANGKTNKVCDIGLDSNGECRDDLGNDHTSYIFRSANDKIFMKDDGDGNIGANSNTGNDTYHGPNEVIKLKIYDNYYNDNYGQYNLSILRGVGDNGKNLSTVGILEYMVRLVEETLLGEIKSTDVKTQDASGQVVTNKTYERKGGIIKFMYLGIVQNSGFILMLQITLSLYITFYGLAVLMGIAEVSKKELMTRLVKVSLVIFFTSPNSWYFYNHIIVGFFYDSMNYVVSMLMSISDNALAQEMNTSAILNAQMDRAVDISSSTRFSYIDSTIKMMLSAAFAGKVFSLFFSDIFGFVYVVLIYGLVVFFILVMAVAASMYLVNIMQIIFVLCLGPIFITFSLFSQTNGMFKNWIAFLGARSLEIILIFAILYNFVMLIDAGFRDLLSYRACVAPRTFGMFTFNILTASGISDRTIVTWLTSITKIAALIFITYLVLNKVAEVAGHLITIGGIGNKSGAGTGHNQAAFNMAGAGGGADGKSALFGEKGTFMGDAFRQVASTAYSAIGGALSTSGAGLLAAVKGASMTTRALGIDGTLSKIGNSAIFSPISVPRKMARDALIGSSIEEAKKEAAAKGLIGAAANNFIRSQTHAKIENQSRGADASNPKLSASRPILSTLLGTTNSDHVNAKLDKELIHKPLAEFIAKRSEELKANSGTELLLGKAMTDRLKADSIAHAKATMPASDAARVTNMVNQTGLASMSSGDKNFAKNLNSLFETKGNLSSKQAAQLLAHKPEEQNKYLQHLQDQSFKRQSAIKEAKDKFETSRTKQDGSISNAVEAVSNFVGLASNYASRGVDGLSRVTGFGAAETRNPEAAALNFQRNLRNKEREGDLLNKAALNPLNRSTTLDRATAPLARAMGYSTLDQRSGAAQQNVLRNYLAQDNAPATVPPLKAGASAQEQKEHQTKTLAQETAKKDFFQSKHEADKRAFFQDKLESLATKDLAKKVSQINKLERKGKIEDATKAKKDLLERVKNDLFQENADGSVSFAASDSKSPHPTLFEKVARLDYLRKQFGIEGESLKTTLASGIKSTIEEGVKTIEKDMKAGATPANLDKKMTELNELKSSLFTNNPKGAKFDELAKELKASVEARNSKYVETLATTDPKKDMKQIYRASDFIGRMSVELADPFIGGAKRENEKTKVEENTKVSKDTLEGKQLLDQMNADVKGLREKLQKEESEKQALQKEDVLKTAQPNSGRTVLETDVDELQKTQKDKEEKQRVEEAKLKTAQTITERVNPEENTDVKELKEKTQKDEKEKAEKQAAEEKPKEEKATTERVDPKITTLEPELTQEKLNLPAPEILAKAMDDIFTTAMDRAVLAAELKENPADTEKVEQLAKITTALEQQMQAFDSKYAAQITEAAEIIKSIDEIESSSKTTEQKITETQELKEKAQIVTDALSVPYNADDALGKQILAELGSSKDLSKEIIPGLKMSDLGLTVPDLGLTPPDLGLKASNFLLGTPDSAATSTVDAAKMKELGIKQNQLNAMLKLSEMNLKFKEYELKCLEKTPENASTEKALQAEIQSLKDNVAHLETNFSKTESAMKPE